MKRIVRALGTVGLGCLVAACSGGADDPPPFAQSRDALTSKLEAATGVKWRAISDSEGLRVLAPEAPVRLGVGTAKEQATSFLREPPRAAEVARLERPDLRHDHDDVLR